MFQFYGNYYVSFIVKCQWAYEYWHYKYLYIIIIIGVREAWKRRQNTNNIIVALCRWKGIRCVWVLKVRKIRKNTRVWRMHLRHTWWTRAKFWERNNRPGEMFMNYLVITVKGSIYPYSVYFFKTNISVYFSISVDNLLFLTYTNTIYILDNVFCE